jgi:penicillin amidase
MDALSMAMASAGAVVVIAVLIGLAIRSFLTASLPSLSGRREIPSLKVGESVTIETDDRGVPRIIGECEGETAFGLGYVHARDRFFQMDLARRYAAGELAELLGPGAAIVESDRSIRRHRLRALCESVVKDLSEDQRVVADRYTAGVNQALSDLRRNPWEYTLLKSKPRPWIAADSLLVCQSIYLGLEGGDLGYHQANALMSEILPPELLRLLLPEGSEWDAPIEGMPNVSATLPGPDVVDLRKSPYADDLDAPEQWDSLETKVLGSNGWAVSGKRAHGRTGGPALIANDMHLYLGLPPVWYKASLVIRNGGRSTECQGVSMPGGPAIIAGSNGRIAWGLTSAQGDWGDLLTLEIDPADARRYRTPDGWAKFVTHEETIKVRGEADIVARYDWTNWGPVVDSDLSGRPRVWRWVAQEREGIDLSVGAVARCDTVDEALSVAARCGVPHVNFLVGDASGRIGWTIMGRVPNRLGTGFLDERLPLPAADARSHWAGYLEPEDVPRVVDPPEGLIWSANHRMVEGESLAKIGRGRYDRGVRATRIRDLLRAESTYDEAAMGRIQMDDLSLLAVRWRDLFLTELTDGVAMKDRDRATFRNHLRRFDGRAAADSVGYALVNQCRLRTIRKILGPLTAPMRRAELARGTNRFSLKNVSLEAPTWAILSERPLHLLSPKYETWRALLLEAIDETVADAVAAGWPPWGEVNVVRMAHPFAKKLGFLTPWLAARPIRSSGALTDIPKIQTTIFGASQRMAVFPGLESAGFMQLPGGQSGHPASPHFLDLLEDWIAGRPTPLKAGEAVATMRLFGSGS